ncbi:MAG: M23 family metallopeptidase [Spirochaetaceae bacterium]|jgi:murein DD-endopeptidase MepM/ murein hydrolase activator NlpD|nr:M23 family metallopeptidase [Spirochaetaceae bacterium]
MPKRIGKRILLFTAFFCLSASGLFAADSPSISSGAAVLEHVVQAGETLYSIARLYGLAMDELCTLNNIRNSSMVKTGQRLILREKDVGSTESTYRGYTVQPGDTIYSLARVNDISVEQLIAVNKLGAGASIRVGQTIRIPGTADKAALSSPSQTRNSQIMPTRPGNSQVQWPVQATSVTYVKGKISGVQLASAGNANVSSMSGGTVVYSGEYRGFGNTVFVQGAAGLVYAYTGLDSIYVTNGNRVSFGDTLGIADGRLTFMVYRNGSPMDPAAAPRE